ncbi:MAG TPA: hypothetical protein IAC50_09185 [Candidatus Copromorpha excrementigallinarum]|uniref:Uncharacterized protein n=1 Tax=Candidatus Allocopromorpha excrementigallinarum TaxID=2840742 RepID=A0A9D1I1V5_9FIRM|nr:hypothetical protein [Candidatus Copromorpha excrementigallinarum]
MEDTRKILEALGSLNEKVTGIQGDLAGVKEDVGSLKDDVSELKEDVGNLKEDVGELKDDVGELKKDVSELKDDVGILKDVTERQGEELTAVKLMHENEIRQSIQLIAEGHLSLERKLDESLKVNQEREMLLIRVAKLETEVRELKAKIK